jgi:serine/threonine protein kinase
MVESRTCGTCGAKIQAQTRLGHCPKCLLELGFALDDPAEGHLSPEGRVVGDYELLEQIGRGGMGVVYKARQISLNRLVAVKMIVAGSFASPSTVHRFQVEAEAAARLEHPNIVSIFEIGAQEGLHYFSMRWVPGSSLQHLIQAGGFRSESSKSPREVQQRIAELMVKIARAVDYAHSHGVIHRDLKPSNILLDESGEPHLTDFGLAKILEHEIGVTATAEVLGTPNYMAPEQARGGKSGKATDVYSLGAICFELLTGRPPFVAPTIAETLRQLSEQEPPSPRGLNKKIDADLSTIVMKAIEKESARRYHSAGELAADLERWLRREPILARRASLPELSRRWVQRNPMAAALIGTLVAALGISLVLLKNAKDQEHAKQNALTALKRSISAYVHQIGTPPARLVQISSKQLRILSAQEPLNEEGAPSKHFTVGTFVASNPMETILGYAKMFAAMERTLSAKLGRAVRLDLNLYLDYDQAREDLVNGQIAFGRVDPRLYLEAEAATNLALLAVEQVKSYPGVIFARADTGITNLAGLRGKSLLFWDNDSTVSLFAKKVLHENGLCATSVQSNVLLQPADRGRFGYMEVPPESYLDHECKTVRNVIKAKTEDAGVALTRNFRLYSPESWTTLAKFEVPRSVWAASPMLTAIERGAIGEALSGWNPDRGDARYGQGFEVNLSYAPSNALESARVAVHEARRFDHCAVEPALSRAVSSKAPSP